MHPQSVAAAYHLRHLRELLRHHLRYLDLALHVVVVLLEAAHPFHMLRIVGVVIVHVHRGQLIEALHEHTLTVGIDEAQRTSHLHHSPGLAPVLDSLQQSRRYLEVVDKVEPPEAHLMAVPALVGPAVDNRRHTSNHLPVLISQEVGRLTTLKRRVLIAAQRVHLIEIQERHGTVVPTIQIIVELHKLFQFFFGCYLTNFNHRRFTFTVSACKDKPNR